MSLGLGGVTRLAALRTQTPCKCSHKVRDPLFRCITSPVQRQQRSQRLTPTSLGLQRAPAPARLNRRQVLCKASGTSSSPPVQTTSASISEPARKNLANAAAACRRFGWLSFWTQLTLSIVSAIILLFSVAFTSSNGPSISLYLTLFGVVAGFLSTFWSFGYTRLSRRLYRYLSAGADDSKRIRKSDVLSTLARGSWINILGLGATLLGLQATVGLLVAKTLTNATANPFLAGGAGSYNPVLALDVFLVQASTNTLLSHFASLTLSLWLIRVVGKNAGPSFTTNASSG